MTHLAFDMDGTIYDCTKIIYPSFEDAVAIYVERVGVQLELPSLERMMSVVGQTVGGFFPPLFPGLDDAEYEVLAGAFRKGMVDRVRSQDGSIYDSIDLVLQRLAARGYVLHMASNGQPEYLAAILQTYGLSDCFGPLVTTSDEGINTKGDILRRYRAQSGGKELMIMIGDRESDRAAAEENGLPFIACHFGHAEPGEVFESRWSVNTPAEIPALVALIEQEWSVL